MQGFEEGSFPVSGGRRIPFKKRAGCVKVVEDAPEGKALLQLRGRCYADTYRSKGWPIHLIGVEFSKTERNIVGFDVETL